MHPPFGGLTFIVNVRKLSFYYILLLIIALGIVSLVSNYTKTLYYNSVAENSLTEILVYQLTNYKKEKMFIPFMINVKDTGNIKEFEKLVKDKNVSVICNVSDSFNSFVIVAKHKKGNKIYGIDSDNFKIKYTDSYKGYRLKPEDCPKARDNIDDLKGWIYVGQLEPHKIIFGY